MYIPTETLHKDAVNTGLPQEFILIGYASFEKRSTTVPLSMDIKRINRAIMFRSRGNDDDYAANAIEKKLGNRVRFTELDLSNPVNVARALTEAIKSIISSGVQSLVIDITTFTHEVLLMLLKLVLRNKDRFQSVFCLYNGADGYSLGDLPEKVWLSKGCKDVRNVIGYPGLIRPSEKSCLVLLTGFELERATRLIELIEPDKLMLGKGKDPTSENNMELMTHFHGEFEKWQANYKKLNSTCFCFSCKNIDETVKALTDLIAEQPEDNYIIVPLNTKLSTVATSIVALQNRRIQVCYSIPEAYNTKSYSAPSESITVVSLYQNELYCKTSQTSLI